MVLLQNDPHTRCQKRAPRYLSRHPTGDIQPPKMVLSDVHNIRDSATIPPPSIPTHLIAGVCIDDQLHAIRMENQLHGSLISALHSTHIVDWEQVQIATLFDKNVLLLLSTIKDGFPEFKHQLPPPITSSWNTCTAVMALSSTRTTLSFHPH